TGAHATVYLNPDRAASVSRALVCANHQDPAASVGASAAFARSVQRQQTAMRALEAPRATLGEVIEAFMTAPIHSRAPSSPTVYSAVYRPDRLTVDYLWPGNVMTQRIGSFTPGEYVHDYGTLSA